MKKTLFLILVNFMLFTSHAQTSSFANYGVFGSNSYDYCNAIVPNNAGSFFMAGTFSNTLDFNPSSVVANFTATNYTGFISKYSVSTGVFQGIRLFANTTADSFNFIEDMVIDTQGNWLITGKFKGTVDFDASATVNSLTNVGGIGEFSYDAFICKYSSTGNFIWVKPIAGNGNQLASDIAVDSANNILCFGQYDNTSTDFDAGVAVFNLPNTGLFVTKYDTNGNFIWAKTFSNFSGLGYDLAIDANDNLYFTGGYHFQADFDPGTAVFTLPTAGSVPDSFFFRDVFILKLNNNGEFLWVKRFGGTGPDFGNSLAFDNQNNVYCGGEFWNTCDFDTSIAELNITSAGRADGFISKFDTNGNFLNVKTISGLKDDYVKNIVIDAGQNLIATGSFLESCNFGSTANPSIQTNVYLSDPALFLVAYDTQNNVSNFKRISHHVADGNTLTGTHLALDSDNNLLAAANFTGSIPMYLAGNPNPTIFPGNGSFNDFLYVKDIFTTLSNSDFTTLKNTKIYPNPTNSILNIDTVASANLQISDLLGKVVFENKLENGTNALDIGFLKSGIYLAKIQNEKGIYNQKIIKEQ